MKPLYSHKFDLSISIGEKTVVLTICGTKRRECSFMKKNQTIFMKLCLADALIKLMATHDFDTINVNAICEKADIGRTTFYRHFDNKNNKEELLTFKIQHEWEHYMDEHEVAVKADKGFAMMNFIYDNRRLFKLINDNGLVSTLMTIFERLILTDDAPVSKDLSYVAAYFTYGYFGVIYQWIKYNFDETPEQIQKHIGDAFTSVPGNVNSSNK